MSLKSLSVRGSRFIIYATAVVVINLVLAGLPFLRLDFTERKSFTLSSFSKEVFDRLQEPLTIRVYLSDKLPSNYSPLRKSIEDQLQLFAQTNNKNFNYKINIIKDGEDGQTLRSEAQSYGIYPVSIPSVSASEQKIVSVFLGLVIVQGDSIERINLQALANIEYELTAAIEKLSRRSSAFLQLPEDVKIYFYFSSSLTKINPEWQNLPESYRRLVTDELAPAYFNRVQFQTVDPNNLGGLTTPEELRLASLELTENGSSETVYASLVVVNGEQRQALNLMQRSLSLNSLFGGGGSQYTINIPAPEDLKEPLAQILEQLVGVNQKISYVSNLGTPPLAANPYQQQPPQNIGLDRFNQAISQNYDLQPVEITESIPAATKTLILVNPTEKLNAWQLYLLDQYLMYGGNLALYISPYNQISVPQAGSQSLNVPNVNLTPGENGEYTLADLLKHYGIEVQNVMLFDKRSYIYQGQQAGQAQRQNIYYLADIRNSNFNPNLIYLKNIQQTFYDRGAPLVLDETKVTPLMWSSEQAWTQSIEMQSNPQQVFPPADDQLKRYPLMALRTGEISSFFAGKEKPEEPQPEEPAEDEENTEEEILREAQRPFKDSGDARLLVSGSAYSLDNNIMGLPDAVSLAVNGIHVVSGNMAIAELRAKGQTTRLLNPDVGEKRKQLVTVINIFATPALMIIVGVLMFFTWRSKRKKLAAMFQGVE